MLVDHQGGVETDGPDRLTGLSDREAPGQVPIQAVGRERGIELAMQLVVHDDLETELGDALAEE